MHADARGGAYVGTTATAPTPRRYFPHIISHIILLLLHHGSWVGRCIMDHGWVMGAGTAGHCTRRDSRRRRIEICGAHIKNASMALEAPAGQRQRRRRHRASERAGAPHKAGQHASHAACARRRRTHCAPQQPATTQQQRATHARQNPGRTCPIMPSIRAQAICRKQCSSLKFAKDMGHGAIATCRRGSRLPTASTAAARRRPQKIRHTHWDWGAETTPD